MNVSQQLANQFKTFYFGANWTASTLKDNLANVTWQQATTKVYDFNTIASLVYHMNYYVTAVTKVLQGKPLIAKDELSFNHPPIKSQKDWEDFLEQTYDEARIFADLVEQFPEHKLWENIAEEKYGSYYRNLHGIVEHAHYHLGQIVLIKKLLN